MKPGYRTSEFWLSLAAAVVGLLMMSGVLGAGTQMEQIAGMAAQVLATMGYSFSRGKAKSAELIE